MLNTNNNHSRKDIRNKKLCMNKQRNIHRYTYIYNKIADNC